MLLSLDDVVRSCELYPVMDGAVEFIYVLTHFLPPGSVISDRDILKSLTLIVDSSMFPCSRISFCL